MKLDREDVNLAIGSVLAFVGLAALAAGAGLILWLIVSLVSSLPG